MTQEVGRAQFGGMPQVQQPGVGMVLSPVMGGHTPGPGGSFQQPTPEETRFAMLTARLMNVEAMLARLLKHFDVPPAA